MRPNTYENDETMNFAHWAKRHRGMPNDMGKAWDVFREYPDVPAAVRSFRTGCKDLRAAVQRFIPGGVDIVAPYDVKMRHLDMRDTVMKAWRKYQNYLRNRKDIGAPVRHMEQRNELAAKQAAQAVEPKSATE